MIFQPLYYTSKTLTNIEKVISRKCLLTKKPITLFTDNGLSPTMKWHGDSKFWLVFKRSCIKQKSATYTLRNLIFFVVHELDTWSRDFL